MDEIPDSVVGYMTNNALESKGCLMHFTMHKDYSVYNIENITNSFESKLDFDNISS